MCELLCYNMCMKTSTRNAGLAILAQGLVFPFHCLKKLNPIHLSELDAGGAFCCLLWLCQ